MIVNKVLQSIHFLKCKDRKNTEAEQADYNDENKANEESLCCSPTQNLSQSVGGEGGGGGGGSSLPSMRSPACCPAEAAGSSADAAVTEAAAAPALECVCGAKTGVCDAGSPEGWGWW